MWLVCDCGYGFPNEARPRQEKLNAICRQVVNFLQWQQQCCDENSLACATTERTLKPAKLLIVLGTGEEVKNASQSRSDDAATEANTQGTVELDGPTAGLTQLLLDRMKQVWLQEQGASSPFFPEDRVLFTFEALPDAILRLASAENLEEGAQVGDPLRASDSNLKCDEFCTSTLDGNLEVKSSSDTTLPSVATGDAPDQVVRSTNVVADETSGSSKRSVVYLSPDASDVLDVSSAPPSICIVGMLIDRRTIQVNRSMRRAHAMVLPTARWPLEQCVSNGTLPTVTSHESGVLVPMHPNEPLNVDCILEGMQQWDWNWSAPLPQAPLIRAIQQALRHHQQRHPERVRHKPLDDVRKGAIDVATVQQRLSQTTL